MEIIIAGGHGKIALHLERMLSDRGHSVKGLIRNPSQGVDLSGAGAEPVVCDLEALESDAIAEVIGSADAFVFAAGAGPNSGPERKWTVDYGGVVKTIEACRKNGIDRYVIVSAMRADPDAEDDGGFGTYLRAKGRADQKLAESGLGYTVVRPGMLNDYPGTGSVEAGSKLERGDVPREDVAAAIAEVLECPGTSGISFDLVGGDTPIEFAISQLAGG